MKRARAVPAVRERVDRTPHVSDDPEQIAEVRKLHEQEVDDLFQEALEEFRKWPVLRMRDNRALKQPKDRARAEMKRIMTEDAAATDELRARAARILLELGDRAGEDFLLDAVRNGGTSRRAAALVAFDKWDLRTRVDLDPPDCAALILACLDDPDPDVVSAAAHLCSTRRIPGTEAKLARLLEDGRARNPTEIARELARVAESPEAVGVMLNYLLRDRPAEPDMWTYFYLERLIKHPNPDVSELVRTAFLRFLLGYKGKLRYHERVVCDLGHVADRTTIPVLEDILANAKDLICRRHALDALARLDPEPARERVLEFIRAENCFEWMTSTLEGLASEQNADRIIDAFLDSHQRNAYAISHDEAWLLIDRLGPRGRKVIEESLDKLEWGAWRWAKWKFEGLSLDTALDDMKAAGIIKMSREEVLEPMRQFKKLASELSTIYKPDPLAINRFSLSEFLTALSEAGVLTLFDPMLLDTQTPPCYHHDLVMTFAGNSGGGFDPECAVQTWHQKNKEDLDAPYTVRFLYKGRVYRFGAESCEGWYDVQAVHRAVTFALETAGRKERFIALDTGGMDTFVFADPEAFGPFAAKYGLRIRDYPDTAMPQG